MMNSLQKAPRKGLLLMMGYLLLVLFCLVSSYQSKQMLDCFLLWYVMFNTHLFTVEAHLLRSSTNVSVVRISHFSRSINDSSHDTYFKSFHAFSGFFDASNGGSEVVEGSSAAWTRDVFGFNHA